MATEEKRHLIVIVGETGVGKSALAMNLAEKFNGEIIAADSRTVYKGMDIGTAKPTKDERRTVKHHLLDVVEPHQKFSVAEFKKLANEAIKDITNRGKLPILVGGSGLYIDSILYDYKFDPQGPRDPLNPRHRLKSPLNNKLRANTIIVGIKIAKNELEKRVERRTETMLELGLIDEVKRLLERYPAETEAFKAPGYKAFIAYAKGQISLDEAKKAFVRADLQLAKRQRTWFKRNKSIHWVKASTDPSYVVEQVTTVLNK